MTSTAETLAWLDERPTLARTIAAARRLNAAADSATAVRFAILRNVTLEPGLPASIEVAAARSGFTSEVYLGEFDGVQGDVFDDDSALYRGEPDVIVLALRLHVLAPRLMNEFAALSREEIESIAASVLSRVQSFVDAIQQRSKALILVHNFERSMRPAFGLLDRRMPAGQTATIDGLNQRLADLCDERGAHIVDVDGELAYLGYANGIDDRYWHLARAPYTLKMLGRLATIYVKAAAALKGGAKKCLVLDCDNTLWGGVIGEDGMPGIKLGPNAPGSAFVEFHAAILDLYHRGILLALNSKNNENDALEVFERHPATLLKPEHFVARRINWQDKATNLTEIAAELNIGIDSLVFVDDNPVECRLVRERLPQVRVIELPRDPSTFARLLRDLPWFDNLTLSSEDRRRSDLYRSERRRSELQASSVSMDDFLGSLGMKLDLQGANALNIPRIAQLTQKTNQFNLTTRRYSESEVEAMAADSDCRVVCASLTDTFDNLGIIAVAITRDGGAECTIDTFLMSCRVIGRGVEAAMMSAIARSAKDRGKERLVGDYLPTAKNGLAADFLQRMEFVQRSGGATSWELPLDRNLPAMPLWFREVENRDDACLV